MIKINKNLVNAPTVCKWCRKLPMERQKTFFVEIEGHYKDTTKFIICEQCLREMKTAINTLK